MTDLRFWICWVARLIVRSGESLVTWCSRSVRIS